MLLFAVSVLVVAQSSSEIPEGLMNNPVYSFPTSPVAHFFCITEIDKIMQRSDIKGFVLTIILSPQINSVGKWKAS